MTLEAARASLAEFTRRLLREEGVVLHVPQSMLGKYISLPTMIGECIPARLLLPDVKEHPSSFVRLTHEGDEIGRLSGPEPDLNSVWVRGEVGGLTLEVLELAGQFLAAGYPGCRDCLGPAANESWDEHKRRKTQTRA